MAVYYCSPTGTGSGVSTAAPMGGFYESIAKLAAGDTLKVMAGTYSYGSGIQTVSKNGTSGSRITVEAESATLPIIKSSATFSGDYMTFRSIRFQEPSGGTGGTHTYRLSSAVGTNFEDCIFEEGRAYALLLMPSSGPNTSCRFDRCVFRNNYGYSGHSDVQDHLIYAVARQTNVVVSRCLFYNSPRGRGLKFGPSGGSDPMGGITVEYCTFYNNRGYANITFTGTPFDITIHRCLFSVGGNQNLGNQQQTGSPTNVVFSDSYLHSPGTHASNMFNTVSGVVTGGADPQFTDASIGNLVPQNAAAEPYGRWAGQAAGPPPPTSGTASDPTAPSGPTGDEPGTSAGTPLPGTGGTGGNPSTGSTGNPPSTDDGTPSASDPVVGVSGAGNRLRTTLDNLQTASTPLALLPGQIRFIWQHERDPRRVWVAVGERVYLSIDGGVTFAARGVPNPGNSVNWIVEAFDNIGVIDVLAGRNVYTSFDDGHNFGDATLEGPSPATARCYASGHERHWVGFTGVTAPASPLRSVEGDIAAFPAVTPEVTEIRALTMMVEEPIMFAFDGQGRIWKFEVTAGNDGEHVNTLPDV